MTQDEKGKFKILSYTEVDSFDDSEGNLPDFNYNGNGDISK